ncbi:resolvase [Candidatus Nitrosocosmicus franklandus]|uniref:Archaeal holliday junction resolvase (Hjc) n=1 Tax=Candidatus Nitrosocosmicus franklandianus TaxID=1798806 RepID=A0A484IBH6_9ARCH|nr:resolvase [Candidatus Nitrosocosmicus franklandus]VFJ15104.1 Archaeal holliday junction resolvase (Hjc) [Candidatus Nitrosocosmicus franklandus]
MTNIRRSRGYNFEHGLVKRLNNGDWIARRLGGSSTGLPDIVAVNNKLSILLSIEAKSATGNSIYVPPDQIMRCHGITKMFKAYNERYIILAFKFMRVKRQKIGGKTIYVPRKTREYYKIIKFKKIPKVFPSIKCNYDGDTFAIHNAKIRKVKLKNFQIP